MIIDFSIKNFLSFKSEVSLSLLADNNTKELNGEDDSNNNLLTLPNTDAKLLKVAAVYGANGSGKSNLVNAFVFFKDIVLNSFVNDRLLSETSNRYFLFDTDQEKVPTSFEMIFIINGVRYRYGFEILDKSIDSEWLFEKRLTAQKESYCFKRSKKNISVNARTFKGSKTIVARTRHNALFLSTCAQYNIETAMLIKEWLRKRLNILSGINDDTIAYTARQIMHNPDMRKRIVDFIRVLDRSIDDIHVTETDVDQKSKSVQLYIDGKQVNSDNVNSQVKRIDITTTHKRFHGEALLDSIDIPFKIESLGTMKILSLLGPWFDTILNGGTLIIDEFGASLHTSLIIKLVEVFQSKLNRSSQLILTTHDTNLLDKRILRRDQVWFCEKDDYGNSDLYSLVEYKIDQATSVRNDAAFEKNYLLGKYGAIPFFGNIERFISDYSDDGEL